METRNSAQIVAQAYEAEELGRLLEASELYQLAVSRYPVSADPRQARYHIAALRSHARRCLAAHIEAQQNPLDPAHNPLATTIRNALHAKRRREFLREFEALPHPGGVRIVEHALPERSR